MSILPETPLSTVDAKTSAKHLRRYHEKASSATCVADTTAMENIIPNIKSGLVFLLQNLLIGNISKRQIYGYCYTNKKAAKHKTASIVSLGKIKYYNPDRSLTLQDVSLFLERKADNLRIIAAGVHDLCGTEFHYTIAAEDKQTSIFHGHTNGFLKVSVIEMSHMLTDFSPEIRKLLTKVNHSYSHNGFQWTFMDNIMVK